MKRKMPSDSSMVQVLWIHPEVLPVCPHMPPLFIPLQRFAHVKSIFTRLSAGRIIAVIIDYSPIDAVSIPLGHVRHESGAGLAKIACGLNLPQALIQIDCSLVPFPHEQVDKPSIFIFAALLERRSQALG